MLLEYSTPAQSIMHPCTNTPMDEKFVMDNSLLICTRMHYVVVLSVKGKNGSLVWIWIQTWIRLEPGGHKEAIDTPTIV